MQGSLLSWPRRVVPHSIHQRLLAVAIICSLLLGLIPAGTVFAALPAPQLTSPADGVTTNPNYIPSDPLSYPPEGVPTFTWQPVTGASRYQIDISTTIGFNVGTVIETATTYSTTYTPKSNTKYAGGTYYWRVRALDKSSAGGDYSEIRSFTQDPGLRISLISPADNPAADPAAHSARALWFTPRFSWTSVSGADHYVLDISSDDTFGTHISGYPLALDGTSYTPTKMLPNDVDYYWRVKAVDRNGNEGPWTETRTFLLKWSYGDRRPHPLTPVNGSDNVCFPVFSWEPVQGAEIYHLEVHLGDPAVNDPAKRKISQDTPNTSYNLTLDSSWPYIASGSWYYWYVQAYNAAGNAIGQRSDTFSFRSGDGVNCVQPTLIYPPYYYQPAAYEPQPTFDSTGVPSYSTVTNLGVNVQDPSVSVPTFIWDRLPGDHEYEIQVATTEGFTNPLWSERTRSLSITPLEQVGFVPNVDYYWRVRATDIPCPILGWQCWSQAWKFQLHGSPPQTVAPDNRPTPLRPTYRVEWDYKTYGQEVVEFLPSFEWTAVRGATDATRYRIQLSTDPDFGAIAYQADTAYTNLTPSATLPYGTYYWRVSQQLPSAGSWSDVSRFVYEQPPRWINVAGSGGLAKGTIAIDGTNSFGNEHVMADVGTPAGVYALDKLYAAVGADHWYFGFNATPGASKVRYLLYIDVDHSAEYGATGDPIDTNITFAAPHRPEYVVKMDMNKGAGALELADTSLFSWNGTSWSEMPFNAAQWGSGSIAYDPAGGGSGGFVELRLLKTILPLTAEQTAVSLSLKLVSTSWDDTDLAHYGQVQATAPLDSGTALGFATISRAPSPLVPFNFSAGKPDLPVTPRFSWHTVDGATTYRYQAAVDGGYSTRVEEGWAPNGMLYDSFNSSYTPRTAWGDNTTYYWRMSVVNPYTTLGSEEWGETTSFRLTAFQPRNLSVSPASAGSPPVVSTRPTFKWDPVEGAATYSLELIANGGDFAVPLVKVETENTSYTHTSDLADGSYIWRVRIKKAGGAFGPYSANSNFDKQYPKVQILKPQSPVGYTGGTPTFQWSALSQAAYYVIETATDKNFTTGKTSTATDNTSYTPTSLFGNNTYYWRVAMVDGAGKYGPYQDAIVIVGPVPPNLPNKVYLPFVTKP